jgi:hypothetical protein
MHPVRRASFFQLSLFLLIYGGVAWRSHRAVKFDSVACKGLRVSQFHSRDAAPISESVKAAKEDFGSTTATIFRSVQRKAVVPADGVIRNFTDIP